jgi:LPS-assembly lipoprotein
MSSDEAIAGRRMSRRMVAAMAAALTLSGCIRPLYSDTTMSTQGASIRSTLAAIDVPMIPDSLGHTMRNELVYLLEGRNAQTPKRYKLLIATNESVATTVVNSAFQRADAASVQATANYRLLTADHSRVILNGSVTGFATYERTPQRFSNLRAARDAQQRVARHLAEQIHLQLATRLAAEPS